MLSNSHIQYLNAYYVPALLLATYIPALCSPSNSPVKWVVGSSPVRESQAQGQEACLASHSR